MRLLDALLYVKNHTIQILGPNFLEFYVMHESSAVNSEDRMLRGKHLPYWRKSALASHWKNTDTGTC